MRGFAIGPFNPEPTLKMHRRLRLRSKATMPMQKAIDDSLSSDGIVVTAIAHLLVSKLETQGVANVAQHFDWIESEVLKRHRKEDGLTWDHPLTTELFGSQEVTHISIEPQDIERLSSATEGAISLTVTEAIETLFASVVDDVREQSRDTVVRRTNEFAGFRRRLRFRWEKPLHLFALQLGLAAQFGADMAKWLRSKAQDSDSALIEALLHLHARACQVASEVEVLLEAGFADGALSRWRTLHEVTTVACFLHKHGNDAAHRYMDHLAVDSYKLALKVKAAGSSAWRLNDATLTSLVAEVEELKIKYGKDFAEEYGWAATALQKQHVTFSDIEKAVDLEMFRPHYKVASTTVHAGPKGAFWRMGLLDGVSPEALLAGPSNAGLAEAGRLTAISLAHISMQLSLLHTVVDSVVWVRVLFQLSNDVGDAFIRVEDKLSSDEALLQSTSRPSASFREKAQLIRHSTKRTTRWNRQLRT